MKLKKVDIILVVVFLIFSFLPYMFLKIKNENYTGYYGEIRVDGKVIKKIEFTNLVKDEEFLIENEYGMNKIHITKDSIEMEDADCKDKVCVKLGKISTAGESIACIPHKLVIEIKGFKGEELDNIISR